MIAAASVAAPAAVASVAIVPGGGGPRRDAGQPDLRARDAISDARPIRLGGISHD